MTLGERLRRMRVAQGMTQRDLASPRYTAAHVSTVESGRRQPSPEALQFFARKLGVTTDEIASGRSPEMVASLREELVKARRAVSSGRVGEAREAYSSITRRAARHRLTDIRTSAELGLALCSLRAGDVGEALQTYERIERRLADDPVGTRVDAIVGKAACLRRMGEVQHSIFVLEGVRDELLAAKTRDRSALFKIHAALVAPYFEAGVLGRARDAAARAVDLSSRRDDPEHLGLVHLYAGRTHLSERDFDAACESFRTARDYFESADLQVEVGRAHLALGFALVREGRTDAARAELDRAGEIFRTTDSSLDEARTLTEIAKLARAEGRVDDAVTVLRRAVELLDSSVDVTELAGAHQELGDALLDTEPDKAEKHLRKAAALYEKTGANIQLAHTRLLLGEIFQRRGDVQAACDQLRAGVAFLDYRS